MCWSTGRGLMEYIYIYIYVYIYLIYIYIFVSVFVLCSFVFSYYTI